MKRVFTIPTKVHDSGPILFNWQSTSGNFLVTTGLLSGTSRYEQVVNIFDRQGEKLYELSLPGVCCGISWDKDGTMLSIICEHSSSLILWDSNTKTVSHVDSGLRDPLTLVVWSKSAPLLAIGSVKGNLLIYTCRTSKKVSVLGKHNKQITFGAWSQQNYLALVASDKTLTLSNVDGDTIFRTNLKGDPSLVQFSSMKQDAPGGGETTVSLILNKKSLFLLNIHDPDDPIVLSFQEKYGTVVDYCWHGEGYILLGFSSGFFIVLSTLLKEIGQEMCHVQCFNQNLVHMAVCIPDNKVIGCGDDNRIKAYDIRNLNDNLYMITVDDERTIDNIQWSDDGQLLAVSGKDANLHVYLTKLPVLGSAYNQKFAFLSSLYEVSIFSAANKNDVRKLKIDIEPKFIAMGMDFLAIGMNNRAWFYNISDTGTELLYDREYLSTVHSLYLNGDYASALIEGKIQLHIIDEPNASCMERESRIFPDADQKNTIITCHALTNDFLIFGTDTGSIQLFSLMEWEFSRSVAHPLNSGIKLLYPDVPGTRILFTDSKELGYIYDPVELSLLPIPNFRPNVKKVVYDSWTEYKGVFMTFDDERAESFIYVRDSIEGSKIKKIHTFARNDIYPGLLVGGELIFLTSTGKTSNMIVPGHRVDVYSTGRDDITLRSNFESALKLTRFDQAYMLASLIKSEEIWHQLANAALFYLDLGTALRVYQELGLGSKVLILEKIKDVEDIKLLSGHVAEFFFKNYELAQSLYLMSSKPRAALDMRKNLFHWDSALKLAVTLSPKEVPVISKEHAERLEFNGDYAEALHHYEKGLLDNCDDDPEIKHHNNLCWAGIARASIRCSNYKRGITIAGELNIPTVYQECAAILEEMKVISDAAFLYEKGGFLENAASLYIKLKNWKKVKEFLPFISSPKVHSQYAKAQEVDGKFLEAAVAYENAAEYSNAIRIYLDYLTDPDSAVRTVKTSSSPEGARMVARFFQNHDDSPSAIKFLVLSACKNEALVLAQQTDNMDVFAHAIADTGDPNDYANIAMYYEERENFLQAGKYYVGAQCYKKGVKLLLQVTGQGEEEALQIAIFAAGKAKDSQINRQLISHIMGENDGVVKDLKHLYNLYLTIGQIKEAAKTAVIIANHEQNSGTYQNARLMLLSMYEKLKKTDIKIPAEMSHSLMLLHSYGLVKLHMKKNDILRSCRMLLRISNFISKFPCHDVKILTMTVLQCVNVGLNLSAHKVAVILMRNEYRSKIEPRYQKKIELVVRRGKKEEPEEFRTPCPYCSEEVPESDLYCNHCRCDLPYCIVTGYHITREPLTACPRCHFPASLSEFLSHLLTEKNCPMCRSELEAADLKKTGLPPENYSEQNQCINTSDISGSSCSSVDRTLSIITERTENSFSS